MKHFIIPDVQVKPGNNTEFLRCIGNYIVDKKPEVIVQIGDFADMESLSSYDRGKKAFEGRRYRNDIQAAKEAMDVLLSPIRAYNQKRKINKEKQYNPRMVLTLGNHCQRINRAVNDDAKLEGVLAITDLGFENDWEVHPFLEVVVVDDVAYSHYFTSGLLGRPASTAAAQLAKKHQSCIAGHQQGFQIATGYRADGKRLTSVIAGSCYEHNEDYLGAQGNNHYRGCIMLNDVVSGEFDVMPVSLSYLKKKYN